MPEPRDLSEGDWQSFGLSAKLNVIPVGPFAEQLERARWDVDKAQQNLRDQRATVIVNLTENVQNVLIAKDTILLEQYSVALSEMRLDYIKTLLDTGSATESQLLQTELALRQAQERWRSAQQQYEQILQNLSVTLGQQLTEFRADLPDSSRPVTPEPLSKRSDVMNAELAVKDAELSFAAALRQALPTVSLALAYSLSPEEGRLDLGASIDNQSFQPNLSLAFDPGRNPGSLPGQSANSLSLRLALSIPLDVSVADALALVNLTVEQSKLRAEQSRELALLDRMLKEGQANSAEVQLSLSQQQLAASQRDFEAAQLRFDLGLIANLELYEAELNLLGARMNLKRAEHHLRLAHMHLAIAYALNPLEVFK